MDDELKQYLDQMMVKINNQFETLLNDNNSFRAGLTYMLSNHLSLAKRLDKLEQKKRKRK